MQAPCARGRGSLLQTQPLTGGKADAAFSQQSHARQCRRRTVQVGLMQRPVTPCSFAPSCIKVRRPACRCLRFRAILVDETTASGLAFPLPYHCFHSGVDSPRGLTTAGQRGRGARASEILREHTPDAEATHAHHHGAAKRRTLAGVSLNAFGPSPFDRLSCRARHLIQARPVLSSILSVPCS